MDIPQYGFKIRLGYDFPFLYESLNEFENSISQFKVPTAHEISITMKLSSIIISGEAKYGNRSCYSNLPLS